jgi:TnpA family transposase
MPVDFLTVEQKEEYGRFSGDPDEMQLARYFHLDDADLSLIVNRRGEQNRLGFGLQLTSVRFLGNFIPDFTRVPLNVQLFVARQLSVNDLSVLAAYAERETTKREHTALIRKYYGYHEFGEHPWSFRLTRLLYNRAWINNERPGLMFDFATAWLIQNKVLLPGATTLTKLISRIRESSANRLWEKLSTLPTENQKANLEKLLEVPDGRRTSGFDHYSKGPVSISGNAFIKSVERFTELKGFGMQELDFAHIPLIRLKILARQAVMSSMFNLARMSDNKRIAMLLAFVKVFETIALDEALDVLDLLITDITGKARKIGQQNRLRTLKDMDKCALGLATACSFILNDKTRDSQLREMIFTQISREKLTNLIATVNELARPADDNFYDEMVSQYSRVRRFLPCLLNNIVFKAAPAGKIVLESFNYLIDTISSRKQILENPPLDIITTPWKRLVFDNEGRVSKSGYTLCFLDKLQDALRRRNIYAENSDRWGDPREKLLQGTDWETKRTRICCILGHPIKFQEAITRLSCQLSNTYKHVAANFDANESVNIDHSGKHPSLTITNLDKLDETPSLTELNRKIKELLPAIELPELLLEIHAHTGFADEFTHVSESKSRAEGLNISICAVLMAEACNIGLKPLIKQNIPALTRHRLNWIKQNYLRSETIIRANNRLVAHQSTLSLANKWGGGDVASADGMRFVVPVRTINSGANQKYFASKRGITWYNFLSDQYAGFHGIVISGTLRDSIFVLEGLLEQQTSLKPSEIMTDTSGVSDMVFGLFWLLGYQFSPRLADAGETVFWRLNKDEDYGLLNELARGCINTHRIEQHWDDMLRIAGSLKLGTVQVSELIRSLLKSERPSGLAQSIIEVGRINKTLYLLNYIDDENYRRRILTQLNRGEGRHFVARSICYGQRGEIRKRYRQGQEDQLGALGLVTNAVVLWNTIYIQAALDNLRQQSFEIKEEDEARLSPLVHGHINMLGHYSFILTENVLKGELRPLNRPSDILAIP